MTWVKICGITNLDDALVAVDAGADAVGFVFYEKSPRFVKVETAREIIGKLPESVEKVGVFVDPRTDSRKILLDAGLTGTQSYFSEQGLGGGGAQTKAISLSCLPPNARFMLAFPLALFSDPLSRIAPMIEGFATSSKQAPDGIPIPGGIFDTFVLDSGNVQKPGGTGKSFDWESAQPIAESFRRNGVRLVVAGGLTPENVGNAIETLRPWGVDVASGVEARPGKKDPERIRAFVRAVRGYKAKVS
jgi:phosphoribosylanthranilate isomerase